MSKRDRSDDEYEDERDSKRLKEEIEEEVALDFLAMLGEEYPAYIGILLQLKWQVLNALPLVSKKHKELMEANTTENFWRAVFMGDIIAGSAVPGINETFAEMMYRDRKSQDDSDGRYSSKGKLIWQSLYESVLSEPEEWSVDGVAWTHKDVEICILVREAYSRIRTRGFFPEPAAYLSYLNTELTAPYKELLWDKPWEDADGNYRIYGTRAEASPDLYSIYDWVSEHSNNEWNYRGDGQAGAYINEETIRNVVSTKDQMNTALLLHKDGLQGEGLLRKNWTFSSTIGYSQFDPRMFHPMLIAINNKDGMNQERVRGIKKDGYSKETELFDNEAFPGIWHFGSRNIAFTSLFERYDYKSNCEFKFTLESLNAISGLFCSPAIRKRYYRKEERMKVSASEATTFSPLLRIETRMDSGDLVLVASEHNRESAHLVHESGERFCDHELPAEHYKKWISNQHGNHERPCPLCPRKHRA